MAYTVYMHRFPNGKVYIGITSQDVEERWRKGDGYKDQMVYRAIKKYGWENVAHEILFTGLSKKEAEAQEIILIREKRSNNLECGYNVANGGNCIGTHSEETKAKISQKNREWERSEELGKKISQALKGRTISEEQKQKIRNTLKGIKFTDEHKRKISEGQKGRVISLDARKKLSETRKKKYWSTVTKENAEERNKKISSAMKRRNENNPEIMERMQKASIDRCSKRIVQKDANGEIIAVWKSAAEIERILGFNHVQISRACHKSGKMFGGFLWEFYDKS